MPPIETMERNQKAVLWEKSGTDRYGEPTLEAPVEIDVRWNDKAPALANSPNKETERIDATAVVAQDIPLGSDMWLGTLNSWYGVGSAGDGTNVVTVIRSRKVPDLKAVNIWREIGMTRKRDKV